MLVPPREEALGVFLRDLPRQHNFRYTNESDRVLRERLFRSLAGNDESKLTLLFPQGTPQGSEIAWNLREAQGAEEGAEYTEAARGRPCGHIFRTGESTYHCKTCAADDTCVLCARCYSESDHEGHTVFISVSPGNSGCCDCADDEAWVKPVHCLIHRKEAVPGSKAAGKAAQSAALPDELVEVIRLTIGKAFDYVCDVFSCSPEQLRLAKTERSVKQDHYDSRLNPDRYGGPENDRDLVEYALVLWNDEKHTVDDVQNQVARACQTTKKFGLAKAMEVNDVGRSVVHYSTNLAELLRMAEIIEQIKVTVTVRSSRDTFREQMCATIIDWVSDIAGCSVGTDPHILRQTVCTEMLKPWQVGSNKSNVDIGGSGIHDHEYEDRKREREIYQMLRRPIRGTNIANVIAMIDPEAVIGGDDDDTNLDDDDDMGDEEDEDDDMGLGDATRMDMLAEDAMDLEDEDGNIVIVPREEEMDIDMDDETEDAANEVLEATLAGYPPPPPPPAVAVGVPSRLRRPSMDDGQSHGVATPQESDDGDSGSAGQSRTRAPVKLPKTPRNTKTRSKKPRPPTYWLEQSRESMEHQPISPAEDLWQRVRLDYLILYDLRLWKVLRINLRHLYIGTVVTLVEFKRILGLRFASLYTMLAQLYLIADREPDHSIINLSVQMLTTPSITAEVVERGNFLTNLLAILYTFLTTRQVGYPSDVNPTATLAFDAGAVTNRRMFHFFVDIRYMFQSTFVQEQLRAEPRYLLQFLDLVKLHQGVCPNVRAIGEHVEYETDTWISASLIIKEINRLCRQVADAFMSCSSNDLGPVQTAIRASARVTLTNSLGLERKRFTGSEIKKEMKFHNIRPFEDRVHKKSICVPDFQLVKEPMSFHHPLHYLLSWMLEAGRTLPREKVRGLLSFDLADVKTMDSAGTKPGELKANLALRQSDDFLCALFEHPLRVCAWLAQMRAGMWVRNGMTLRHQMHTYRSTSQRDVSYQRDLSMLQAGLVLCGSPEEPVGERFLAQMIDRFDMTKWVKSDFTTPPGYEETQQMDVIEDFYHLLIVLLSERDELLPNGNDPDYRKKALQRDIAHVLCFKPLSFSDISSRLTDKIADSEGFDEVLQEMTTYKSPEGLSDSGAFELRSQYRGLIDPYYAFYSRNQREEADNQHRAYMSKQTGTPEADIVYEPKLVDIPSGLYQDLAAFTRTDLFSSLLRSTLQYALKIPSVVLTASRVESLLHVVMHLLLLAVIEDHAREITAQSPESSLNSAGFVQKALDSSRPAYRFFPFLLELIQDGRYSSCHPKIRLIIKRMQQKQPQLFASVRPVIALSDQSASAPMETEDRDAKRKAAMDRQARVMAQFKAQQSSFMEKQGLDWEVDDFSDEDKTVPTISNETHTSRKTRPYPSEPCMLCQEETSDDRLFGSFAYMAPSRILRQTDLQDPDFIEEALNTPHSLDRSADATRPFGVASKNKYTIHKTAPDGSVVPQQSQGLSRGFPTFLHREGPVATGCGHIMHFSCFEAYLVATERRHSHQIARNHPERPTKKEFLCPLCKALGNVFLPIVWKDKEEAYPGVLKPATDFDTFVASLPGLEERSMTDENDETKPDNAALYQDHVQYASHRFISSLSTSVSQLSITDRTPSPAVTAPQQQRPLQSLASMFTLARRQSEFSAETLNAAGASSTSLADELLRAYLRLQESIEANKSAMWQEPTTASGPSDLVNIETLCDALGYSVSAVEIAHRGLEGETTLLTSIPEQSLNHLRILSETVSSYITVGGLRSNGSNRTNAELSWLQANMSCCLLLTGWTETADFDSLFEFDTFTFFTRCSIAMSKQWADIGHHVLRLCYTAEIIKTIYTCIHFHREVVQALAASKQQTTPLDPAFRRLVEHIHAHGPRASTAEDALTYPISDDLLQAVHRLAHAYALPFLRKSVILLHVRDGVDFSAVESAIDFDAPELDRLSTLLQLPTIADVVSRFDGELSEILKQRSLSNLARIWSSQGLRADVFKMYPSHPAIFELTGLPKTYDALTEEAIKRRCPTTGKEISDPAVCLFCGEIFCSQASCCRTKDDKGGCYQHLAQYV